VISPVGFKPLNALGFSYCVTHTVRAVERAAVRERQFVPRGTHERGRQSGLPRAKIGGTRAYGHIEPNGMVVILAARHRLGAGFD